MNLAVSTEHERLIADFMTLVAIGSQSREEANVAAYIRGAIEELGYPVEEDDAADVVGGNCGNLIVRVPGLASKPTILFMAHMDTVAPGNGVQPMERDGRIMSDGRTILGADDKAGVAGLLHMLRVLKSTKEPHPPLEIVFTVSEEAGLLGAKALDVTRLRAQYGFVFDAHGEPGFVATSGPAQAKLHAIVRGKPAHAGTAPEKGINAIEVAARALGVMRLGRIDEYTTANVGMIQGGFATNIVCDTVELRFEARSLFADRLMAQREHMSRVLTETAAAHDAKVELTWTDSYPALSVPEDSFLRPIVTRAMQELSMTPVFGPTGGGSDANVIAGKGIPVVNIAVGYHQVHTLQEWIAVADLMRAADLMVAVVRACMSA